MALRQQQQIDSQHQLLAHKEQRLRFLKNQEIRNAAAENERLRRLRERVEAQGIIQIHPNDRNDIINQGNKVL